MTEELKNQQHHTSNDEIDLISLAKTIWDERKTIIISVIISAIIGVTIALFSPKEYTASTTIIPQVSNGTSKLGGLSSLAAMAGFNLDMGSNSAELSPMIYPQILTSIPFQLEIMNTQFNFPGIEKPISLFQYYTEIKKPGFFVLTKKYTIGLPGTIIKTLNLSSSTTNTPTTNGLIYLTEEQNQICKFLEESISLEVNDKDGYLTLSSRFYNAKLAAQITEKALQLLQQYITAFKIKKASAQLKFIEERYTVNKIEFEEAQAVLADFRDHNRNVTSARTRTQEERLQSEYQLAFDVYSGLAQQLEQAQIKVKEDTPVFSIIKPVTIPVEKSKPKRALILVIWIFLGGIFGIGWIFGKQFLATIKQQWSGDIKKQ